MNIFSPDSFNFINAILNNSIILLLILLSISIIFLLLSIYLNKKNNSFLSSIFMGLFISFVQIVITVFIIEKIIEKYQENQWQKTTVLINEMVKAEIKDDLADIVYMIDFSEYRRPHLYIESHLEKKLNLTKDEAIYAAHKLVEVLKIDDFADHKKYKKGDDIISYQIGILKQFNSTMEINLQNLDRIIVFAQINIESDSYNEIIECRNEYQNIIKNVKHYLDFLGASEITGSLIDYNLNFEMKYKKDMYDSILNTIDIIIYILNKENTF